MTVVLAWVAALAAMGAASYTPSETNAPTRKFRFGMMRAAGIPARFEIGFSLPADQHDGAIPGYHCWAEFYVEPLRWIPVDAPEAWKHPDKKDYFFGAHDDNRA